ncbi:hypothetical protein ACGFI3_44905 [Nonomuraea wenchangensis]|uniref:hypothetical protein n=1 Tax=Nonomuraea wenchangensis TaxID=568860 RepID=UPI003716528E
MGLSDIATRARNVSYGLVLVTLEELMMEYRNDHPEVTRVRVSRNLMEAIRSDLEDLKCDLLPEHFDVVRSTDFAYVLTRRGRAYAVRRHLNEAPSPGGEMMIEALLETDH